MYYCCLVTKSCLTVIPWTVVCQASLSMEFPRQKYWSGLLFPSPGNFPDPRIEPTSPVLQADSLPLSHLRTPYVHVYIYIYIYTYTYTHTYTHTQIYIYLWFLSLGFSSSCAISPTFCIFGNFFIIKFCVGKEMVTMGNISFFWKIF